MSLTQRITEVNKVLTLIVITYFNIEGCTFFWDIDRLVSYQMSNITVAFKNLIGDKTYSKIKK